MNLEPAQFLRPVAVGFMVAALSLVYSISFAVIIFSGPLEPFRATGVTIALTGAVVYALAGALRGSIPGVWWGNQTVTVVVIALAAANLAALLDGASHSTRLATVLLLITVSSVASGLVLALIGAARISRFVRFIPHPVIGGFLAATGYFLVTRAAELALPASATGLLDRDALRIWLPVSAAGLVLVAVARLLPRVQVLMIAMAVYFFGFHAFLWATGTSIESAIHAGKLLDDGLSVGRAYSPVDLGRFAEADLGALLDVLPQVLTITGLSILGVLMNVSGIEFLAGQAARLDRDFRDAGRANVLSGLLGGLPGYHSASMTHLTASLLDRPTPIVGLVGAAVFVAILAGGFGFMTLLPVGMFVLMLSYVGFDILWRWLIDEARQMPRGDFAIVLLILGVTLVFDFATAIAVGLLTASLMFTLAYSRVDVVRARLTGRQRLSPAERSERDVETILAHGDETLIYELQGYLFFGTSEGLFERLLQDLETRGAAARRVILDFRRVAGIDISTAYMLRKLKRLTEDRELEFILTELPAAAEERLARSGALTATRTFQTLPDALTAIEDAVLAGAAPPAADTVLSLGFEALFRRLDATTGTPEGALDCVAAGEILFRIGDPSDTLVFLAEGRLSATVPLRDGRDRTVATFLPGTVVGEIGYYTKAPRTATIRADTACRVRRITRAQLGDIARTDPALAADFHEIIARLLARRLGRTTALVFAIDR